MNKKIKSLATLSILSITYLSFAYAGVNKSGTQTHIQGVWQTQRPEHNARIKIEPCSAQPAYKLMMDNEKQNGQDDDDSASPSSLSEQLCGHVVWLSEPDYPADDPQAGQPKRDRHNPDKSLQNRPVMNMPIIFGFKRQSDNDYVGGHIYNPEDGETYKCSLSLTDHNTLEVRGYIQVLFFTPGKTQVWKRYESRVAQKP